MMLDIRFSFDSLSKLNLNRANYKIYLKEKFGFDNHDFKELSNCYKNGGNYYQPLFKFKQIAIKPVSFHQT
jgi:hypothetical protein